MIIVSKYCINVHFKEEKGWANQPKNEKPPGKT